MIPRTALLATFLVVNVVLAGCLALPGEQPPTSEPSTTDTPTTSETPGVTTTSTTTTTTTRTTLTERAPHFRFMVIAHGELNATITVLNAESRNQSVIYNESHRMTNRSTVSLDDALRMDTRYTASVRVNGTEAWNGTLLPSYGYRLRIYPNVTADITWQTG